ELFRGFQVARDLNKLLLAAAGIVVMAFGWWLLALIFAVGYNATPPGWPGNRLTIYGDDQQKAWEEFRRERDTWNLMYESAGIGDFGQKYDVLDLASSLQEFTDVTAALQTNKQDLRPALDALRRDKKLSEQKARVYEAKYGRYKRYAALSTWPWWEDRGPNPYLLVTGQAGIPWEAGRFWDWFARDQFLVMIEPLVKFVQPIIYFFSPRSTGYTSVYFLCVMLWTLTTWALFGGAITRIAAVQITRSEKIGLREAVRFTLKRILSYLMAPLFPLGFVFGVLFFMMLFGVVHMIPVFGDVVWDGLLWWLMMICGLVMAVTLVGLVGWPLMSATISTEGTDSWEAVTRSYSYVYQKPWHYIWYSLVAIAYGAVLVFFIGFMSSLTVYLAKWGVSETPFSSKNYTNREPTFLFVYAPTSFGWRTLLLEGTTVNGRKLVDNGEIQPSVYEDYLGDSGESKDRLRGWNKIGAFLVTIWLFLFFLLMLGFGYSYFWSASTIIYLLMRRHVDAAELDEVYLEEDEQEGPYGGHFTPPIPAASSAVKPPPSVTMVEAPTLRAPSAAPPSPPPPLATQAAPPALVTSMPPPEPPSSVEPPPAPPSLPAPPPEGEGGVP
ncbi:MAG: hypothetical protein ACRELF_13935, partial [Gemmataceae bacterium]